MFVDAASSPARCAAVLFLGGHAYYTDAAPNHAMWEHLQWRRDKQIMGLVRFSFRTRGSSELCVLIGAIRNRDRLVYIRR